MALYGDDYCSVDPYGWEELTEAFDPEASEEMLT